MIAMILAAVAAQASTPPALPGQGQDPSGFDMRCLAVITQAAEAMPEEQAADLRLAMMFYFGRVDAVLATDKASEHWLKASEELEGRELGPIMVECGNFMEARGKAMESLGTKLEAAQ